MENINHELTIMCLGDAQDGSFLAEKRLNEPSNAAFEP